MMNRTSGIVVAVIASLLVAGISFGVSQSRPPVPAEAPTTVRVGYFQSHTGSAPILIADANGYFTDRNLTAEKQILGSSNMAMDALVRGDVDISILSMIPVLNAEAVDSGKVKIFAVSAITNDRPFDSIVVKNGSGVESVRDLAGKKIAVFPGTTATAFVRQYLTSQGVDISKTEFVQMPLTDHLAALESGAVQAADMYEPVLSIALETGSVHAITKSIFAANFDRSPIGVYVVSTKFLTEHPDAAKGAIEALEEAMAYSNAHPDEAAKAIAAEFKISDAVAARMSPLAFVPTTQFENSFLSSFVDLLISFGEVKSQPDLDTLLYR